MTGAFTQQAGSSRAPIGQLAQFLPPAFLTFYLVTLIAFSKTIISALTDALVAGPKEPRHRHSLLTSLLFFLFVTIIIVALIRFNPNGFLNVIQHFVVLFKSVSDLTHFKSVATGNGSTVSTQTFFLIYYSFIAFIMIFVVSSGLLIIAFRNGVISNRSETVATSETIREKATEIVKRTVTMLESGGSYQDAILACYRQMCIILAQVGLEIGLAQTAREFALQVSQKMRFGKEAINGLTFLFEEARYSQHALGNDKRSMAISQLASLEHELASIGERQ